MASGPCTRQLRRVAAGFPSTRTSVTISKNSTNGSNPLSSSTTARSALAVETEIETALAEVRELHSLVRACQP